MRFDNCGIDDGEMANLLRAFCQFRDFKSIVYRHNELDEESLEVLLPLLKKGIPYHLQELRISSCRLQPNIVNELLVAISTRSFLKQFELAYTALTQSDVDLLGQYALHSKMLEKLDLSGNCMSPTQMISLLDCVKQNKKLI